MHQFSLQVGSVSQMSLVVVKCVVQVGDWSVCTQTQQQIHISVQKYMPTDFLHIAGCGSFSRYNPDCSFIQTVLLYFKSTLLTVELVQASQMIKECFQGLGDRQKLQEAVDDDIKDRQEAQAHIAEVDGQVLRLQLHGRVDLVCKALKVKLFWVFLGKKKKKVSSDPSSFSLNPQQ